MKTESLDTLGYCQHIVNSFVNTLSMSKNLTAIGERCYLAVDHSASTLLCIELNFEEGNFHVVNHCHLGSNRLEKSQICMDDANPSNFFVTNAPGEFKHIIGHGKIVCIGYSNTFSIISVCLFFSESIDRRVGIQGRGTQSRVRNYRDQLRTSPSGNFW